MNPHDTRILQALNTRSERPTAAVKYTVNAAQRRTRYSTDRVRYRLKGLERRRYVRRSTGPGFAPRISWALTEEGKAALVCGEPKKRPPERLYEVVRTLNVGELSEFYCARSRGGAIYLAWLDWREIDPDITFIEFRKRCTARLFRAPAAPTGCYGYVMRHYGLEVDSGDRIEACGKTGIVVPHTQNHYVHFIPDDQDYSVPVHPSDVTVLERRAGA